MAASAPQHSARAGFETVVTIPVRLHAKPMGEVELFFNARITLSESEHYLLEALGRHLASGMENLRLNALEKEAAMSQERKSGWTFSRRRCGALRCATTPSHQTTAMTSTATQDIRSLVVDDLTLFHRGLIALLARDAHLHVVADAADASQAQRKAQELQPEMMGKLVAA